MPLGFAAACGVGADVALAAVAAVVAVVPGGDDRANSVGLTCLTCTTGVSPADRPCCRAIAIDCCWAASASLDSPRLVCTAARLCQVSGCCFTRRLCRSQ